MPPGPLISLRSERRADNEVIAGLDVLDGLGAVCGLQQRAGGPEAGAREGSKPMGWSVVIIIINQVLTPTVLPASSEDV